MIKDFQRNRVHSQPTARQGVPKVGGPKVTNATGLSSHSGHPPWRAHRR